MGEYSRKIWINFNDPKNVGVVDGPAIQGRAGGLHAGPFFALSAVISNGVFLDIRYQTFGCIPSIAAGSVLTEALKGKSVRDATTWTKERLIGELGGLPQDKCYCAELAIAALQDLLNKAASLPKLTP